MSTLDASGEVPARSDFLAWAIGSRRRVAAVVILPVLAGVALGIVATLMHFGMRYPSLMWIIPWGLESHYECFVLPRNIARCCLLMAPLASAVILLGQPRFRMPATDGMQPARGPAIDLPYWPIAAVGVLLMIIIPSAFDLYGAGWEFACRIEDLYGIGGRIALTAFIVLVSPCASIAALTAAYSLRRRFPAAATPEPAAKALKPIGRVLVVVGVICLAYAAATVRKDPGYAAVTGIEYIAAGVLIATGSMGTARLMGWLIAVEIVIAFGNTVSAPLWMPLGLAESKFRTAPVATAFAVALFLASFGFAVWLYQAVRAKPILDARKAAGRTTAPPWTAFALGLLIVGASIVGMVRLQTGDLTAEAKHRARAKYGANYSYHVTYVGIGERDQRVYAQVTGYNDHAVIDADVDWKP